MMKRRREPKLERKTVEKNRRTHMKLLSFKLASLIPPHHCQSSNKDMVTQLDNAASYIKQLKDRIEKLKRIKEQATGSSSETEYSTATDGKLLGLRLPIVELRELGSTIEVLLISASNKNNMLPEVISILHEEGAEVVSASFTNVGDKVFHTIHAQVRISRVGVETTRVYQRLQELIR
uniref:Uncharacterized protein LOC105128559 n=1 Tax=Rhizophora mucronata TaxID=61149 RepID=A0A2P2K3W1_RHIMU